MGVTNHLLSGVILQVVVFWRKFDGSLAEFDVVLFWIPLLFFLRKLEQQNGKTTHPEVVIYGRPSEIVRKTSLSQFDHPPTKMTKFSRFQSLLLLLYVFLAPNRKRENLRKQTPMTNAGPDLSHIPKKKQRGSPMDQ